MRFKSRSVSLLFLFAIAASGCIEKSRTVAQGFCKADFTVSDKEACECGVNVGANVANRVTSFPYSNSSIEGAAQAAFGDCNSGACGKSERQKASCSTGVRKFANSLKSDDTGNQLNKAGGTTARLDNLLWQLNPTSSTVDPRSSVTPSKGVLQDEADPRLDGNRALTAPSAGA